jgi:hypothetical protein
MHADSCTMLELIFLFTQRIDMWYHCSVSGVSESLNTGLKNCPTQFSEKNPTILEIFLNVL